jgi:hypothetical protein
MDEFENDGERVEEPRELVAWTIGPVREGSLVLVLKYAASPSDVDAVGAEVQVSLPPEAALYLSEELTRQAHRILGRPRSLQN